ncbi:MAG: ThuA domain-containing protein [Cytophagales bacterium]|nr:ThuA domain-containing protein [Cytophagales bacterium]
MNRFLAIVLIFTMTISVGLAQKKNDDVEKINVLVFTKTEGFRHQSISNGVKCMWELGLKHHWNVTATEDASLFNNEFLSGYDVVVWLNTTQDVLNEEQQEAFIKFYRGGKGYVGIHAAADTEYDWEWYGKMMGGAWFKGHPPTQEATLVIEDTNHPSMKVFEEKDIERWTVIDEWYAHKANPRPHVNVLMSLDESTVKNVGKNKDRNLMGGDHPMAWYNEFDGGRSFYTNRGHTPESFDDPELRAHFVGGIEWAAGKIK